MDTMNRAIAIGRLGKNKIPTAILVAFLALAPNVASGKCYSIWKYPFPQHCSATALARLPHTRIAVPLPPVAPSSLDGSIPIPDCTFEPGGDADDETRARLLLRVLTGENHD